MNRRFGLGLWLLSSSFACGHSARNFGNPSDGGPDGDTSSRGGATDSRGGTAGVGGSHAGATSSGGTSSGTAGAGAAGAGAAGTGSGGVAGSAGSSAAGSGVGGTSTAGPCASSPCVHGACAVTGSTFMCKCDNGYSGDTCATNKDDCSPNPCANGAACVDGVASSSCICGNSGYAGTFCNLPRFEVLFPGYAGASPLAITPDGSVVVGGGMAALKWTHAAGVQSFPICTGAPCTLSGTSSDGSIPIGSQTSFSTGLTYEVFRLVGSSAVVLPPPSPTNGCSSGSISANGLVALGTCFGDDSVYRAVRWTQSGGTFTGVTLPAPPSASNVLTVALSGDGSNAAGYYRVGTGADPRGLYWTIKSGVPASYIDLGFLQSGSQSQPNAISSDGSTVVGFATSSNGTPLAARWTNASGLQGLPFDNAYGVNADGSVVVGTQANKAVVWSSATGTRLISEVLVAAGVTTQLNGWTLTQAAAVSADGKTIVGTGTGPDGQGDSWLARIP